MIAKVIPNRTIEIIRAKLSRRILIFAARNISKIPVFAASKVAKTEFIPRSQSVKKKINDQNGANDIVESAFKDFKMRLSKKSNFPYLACSKKPVLR